MTERPLVNRHRTRLSEEIAHRSSGGYDYNARLADLVDHINVIYGRLWFTVADLSAAIGWGSDELRAKLMQLRREGHAEFQQGNWKVRD